MLLMVFIQGIICQKVKEWGIWNISNKSLSVSWNCNTLGCYSYVKINEATYFHSSAIQHISGRGWRFIGNKNIKPKILRIQV